MVIDAGLALVATGTERGIILRTTLGRLLRDGLVHLALTPAERRAREREPWFKKGPPRIFERPGRIVSEPR